MNRDFWPIPRDWEGKTAAILAGGPSLTRGQVDAVFEAGIRCATINDSFRLAPWADMHYFCDGRWLDHNAEDFFRDGQGIGVTIDENKKRQYPQLKLVQNIGFQKDHPHKTGLPPEPHQIFHGHNSGYQCLSVVAKRGVKRILLLGYDMHENDGVSHWHGGHTWRKSIKTKYENLFIPALESLAPHLEAAGIEVINCTPGSALHCFEKMPLCLALSAPSAICHITDERLL